MPRTFLDTNVLVYVAASEPAKAAMARDLMSAGGVISVQVLNEAASVALRKMRLNWDEIDDLLLYARNLLSVEPITIETHELGIALAKRHKLALYDAMIAAAALMAGCDTLYSEDMQHGLVIDGALRIENPFRSL